MKLVQCTFERHALPIREILNEAIENSTAVYDFKPRSMENMVDWFTSKEAGNYPVIGLECDKGELLGFASYGSFRAWQAYKYTAEHSVYVHHEKRGKGYGLILMREIIARAETQGKHALIGGIDAANEASIALHAKLGFEHAGTIRQAGFKFGRWLDLAFYQLILKTPSEPVDG